jgi:hypothetical protein
MMTLGITTLSIAIQRNDSQHNDTQHSNTQRNDTRCSVTQKGHIQYNIKNVTPSITNLSNDTVCFVVMLNVMLSVAFSFVMLNVVMLSVVAPL